MRVVVKAIGLESKKVYIECKYRSEVMRFLNKNYPWSKGRRGHWLSENVLPEPIKIVREIYHET